jgi:hypothetical protein
MTPYIQFGSGLLYVNPIGGNLASPAVPLRPLTLQDMSVDIGVDVKELRGQNQFPDDVADSDKKGTGKFSFGRVDIGLFNQMFFADTQAAGGTVMAPLEDSTIPATSTYIITVVHSSTFVTDYGVSFASGAALQRVASGPTAGQYSVASGVYTFAAADASTEVFISYSYTVPSAGSTLTVNNHIQGYGPIVELVFVHNYQTVSGVPSGIKLFAARVTKLNLAMKRTDYVMPECEFSFFANPVNKVIEFYGNK